MIKRSLEDRGSKTLTSFDRHFTGFILFLREPGQANAVLNQNQRFFYLFVFFFLNFIYFLWSRTLESQHIPNFSIFGLFYLANCVSVMNVSSKHDCLMYKKFLL